MIGINPSMGGNIDKLMTSKQRRELVMFALDPSHADKRVAFANDLRELEGLIDNANGLDITDNT